MCRRMFFLICVALVGAAGTAFAGAGPAGWWKFDTGTGTIAYDSSGNNFNGTIAENVFWVPGYVGPYALNFVSGYVSIPDNAKLRPNRLTWSLWINLPAPQESYTRIIQKGNDNSETYTIGIGGLHPDFSMAYACDDDVCGKGVGFVGNLWTDEWIHIAGVYDGNALSVYLNSELNNSNTTGEFTPLQSGGVLAVGARAPDWSRRLMASVDDLRIYDYNMTADEIRELYWEVRNPRWADYPSPENYAEDVDPNAVLSWMPGEGATWHDVYLGTNFNDVNNATTVVQLGVYVGRQEPNRCPAGILELGQTYYWRIDEAETALDPDPLKGKVWTFTIDEGKARNPDPGNWDFCMPMNKKVSWAAGPLAVEHDVYFGTDFNDVDDADTTTLDVYKGTYAVDHNYYDPGPLEKGAVYHWRVDEVSDKVVKGNVWSFGIESRICLKVDLALTECPDTNIIRPETAKPGWWHWATGRWADLYSHDCAWACEQFPCPNGIGDSGIDAAITQTNEGDGGMKVSGLISALGGGMCPWGSPIYDPICNSWYQAIDWPDVKPHIQLAFHHLVPGIYRLYSYHNHFACERLGGDDPSPVRCTCKCDVAPPMPFVGAMSVKDARYLPFAEADSFQKLTLTDWVTGPFAEGVTSLQNAYDVQVQQVTSDNELVPSLIKFATDGSPVLVLYQAGCCVCDHLHGDERCGGRGILNAFVLQLVKELLQAYKPSPEDASENVRPDVLLSWKAGGRVVSHEVYLGTNHDSVKNATTSSAEHKATLPAAQTSYDPCGLTLGKTYYWRVDEVNEGTAGSPWTGDVWSFTVMDSIGIEDFEIYTIDNIYDTWKDGYINGSGAAIWLARINGLPPEPAHGGLQSLGYWYNNAYVYYSEAFRRIYDPCDWSSFGVKVLKLWFYGDPLNELKDNDGMYVAVKDKAGHYAQDRYADANDMNDIKVAEWHEWCIDLQHLADGGVQLADVNDLYIGFGDVNNTQPGSMGYGVYFDDIALHPAVQVEVECYAGMLDYVQWALVGKPECWCYPRQCLGDCDGLPYGKSNYWVAIPDLTCLKDAWNKPIEQLVGNQICADFDHLPYSKNNYRVSIPDLGILKNNWNLPGGPAGTCLPGNRNPPPFIPLLR